MSTTAAFTTADLKLHELRTGRYLTEIEDKSLDKHQSGVRVDDLAASSVRELSRSIQPLPRRKFALITRPIVKERGLQLGGVQDM